jgi:hypothetical protein
MYKASSELIKARKPHTHYVVEQVFVKQIGGGIANQCFQNATDDDLLAKGNKVVSGWIVNAYDKERNSTAIVQHWWNIDSSGNYFDVTPDVDGTMEYIIDIDIVAYGQENFDNLENLVALSLLFQNNEFFSVEQINGSLITKPIASLATPNLFQFS